jgi:hypothetical protein
MTDEPGLAATNTHRRRLTPDPIGDPGYTSVIDPAFAAGYLTEREHFEQRQLHDLLRYHLPTEVSP